MRLGAGERAAADAPAAAGGKLDLLLASDRHAAAARAFAAKHAGFDPAAQVERMAGRVEELLGGEGRRRPASSGGDEVWSKTPVKTVLVPA